MADREHDSPRLLIAPADGVTDAGRQHWLRVDHGDAAAFSAAVAELLGDGVPWVVVAGDGFGAWSPRRRTIAVLLEAAAAVREYGALPPAWVPAAWRVEAGGAGGGG